MNKFEIGEVVLYQNGSRFELGIVKSIKRIELEPTTMDMLISEAYNELLENRIIYKYFVNYHTGDTAALTEEADLHKITNLYAFDIRRKTPEE